MGLYGSRDNAKKLISSKGGRKVRAVEEIHPIHFDRDFLGSKLYTCLTIEISMFQNLGLTILMTRISTYDGKTLSTIFIAEWSSRKMRGFCPSFHRTHTIRCCFKVGATMAAAAGLRTACCQ